MQLASGFCGVTTILNAKLQAILQDIMAQDHGWHNLLCHSNSKVLVDLINNAVSVFHPYYLLVEQIRSFFSLQGHISFSHCFRESNFCADLWQKRETRIVPLLLFGMCVQLQVFLTSDVASFAYVVLFVPLLQKEKFTQISVIFHKNIQESTFDTPKVIQFNVKQIQ